MLTLAFTGDVMLGRLVNDRLKTMQPEAVWGDLLPHLAQADLRIVNLECALTVHLRPWARTWKKFHFRADPKAVRVLQAAHIDACALANNHILDYEERGLRDTLRMLRATGIRYAGAGANAAEATTPAILDAPGASPCRVALLSYTDNEPDFAAAAERPAPIRKPRCAKKRWRASPTASRRRAHRAPSWWCSPTTGAPISSGLRRCFAASPGA